MGCFCKTVRAIEQGDELGHTNNKANQSVSMNHASASMTRVNQAHLSEVAGRATVNGGLTTRRSPSRVACSAEEGCESALAAAEEAPALLRGCPEAGVVGPTTGWLDIPLQQVKKCDSVAEPVAEAGIVVLLALNLAAHGVDDLVEQHSAVCLEDLPLEAAAEDKHRCNWPAVVEAKILCKPRGS